MNYTGQAMIILIFTMQSVQENGYRSNPVQYIIDLSTEDQMRLISIRLPFKGTERHEYSEPTFKEFKPSLLSIAIQLSQRTESFIKKLEAHSFHQLFDWKYNIDNPTKSPICSRVMNAQYQTFRCYDCMESTSSCICAECFGKGDHKGHNYIQYNSVSGCCDCGNEQAWNEKGFCCDHSKKFLEEIHIKKDIEVRFLNEFKLAFDVYLYLMNHKERSKIKQEYGPALFNYLKLVADQNHEMKYLTYLLMKSKPFNFLKYEHIQGLTIMEIMFRTHAKEAGLNQFPSVLFEGFPVQEFRKLVLKEYFLKAKTDDKFKYHPIGQIHFQFMSCAKLITRMIKQDQLEPLQLQQYQENMNKETLPSCFRKLYEDLDYISQMKSGKDYHIIHLMKSNICKMAYYKKITQINQEQDKDLLNRYNLDQFFLKTLKLIIKSSIGEKKVLQKCLRELFQEIIKTKGNSISLAYERAFAMVTLAYFDGNIRLLLTEDEKMKFLQIIDPTNKLLESLQSQIVKITINTKINMQTLINMKEQQLSLQQYELYYLKKYSQKNVPEFLDMIFHKILNLVFKASIYPSVVNNILKRYEQQLSVAMSNEQLSPTIQEMLQKTLYIMLNFLNSIGRINIDEIVISLMLGIDKRKEMIQFLGRLLATYNQIYVKQFNNLALQIINDEELIEDFIKKHTVTTKSKLSCKVEKEPLETYNYNQIIDNYTMKVPISQTFFIKKDTMIKEYEHFKIFDQESIKILMEISMNSLFVISSEQNKIFNYFSLFCMQFLKVYIQEGVNKENILFKSLLSENTRKLLSKDLIQQITIIQNSEMIDFEKNRIKVQMDAENKKKKDRLLNKKKQKQEHLKQNQAKILNSYDKSEMKQEDKNQNENKCIYCKQNKEDLLYYFGYIGLSNLIEMGVLKEKQDFHLYVETCGHMIHLKCINMNHQDKQHSCFLCKSQSNILVPIFSKSNKNKHEKMRVSRDFILRLASVIIGQRAEVKLVSNQTQFDIFMKKYDSNILTLFLSGMAKDICYVACQDYNRYKKHFYSIHEESFQVLKAYDKVQLEISFIQLKANFQKSQNQPKIKELQYKIVQKLSKVLLQTQNEQNFKQIIHPLIDSMKEPVSLNINELIIEVPQQLNHLNQYMGQCKLCNHVTNFIYLCLKCKWSCCRKCINRMHVHSTFHHLDGTVFIGCSNGCIKYFQGERIYETNSVYENYLGESFDEVSNFSEALKCEKFTLNEQKMGELRQIILNYKIHQKIFRNQH